MSPVHDPHGPNVALFFGNLPPNLNEKQYETILLDYLDGSKCCAVQCSAVCTCFPYSIYNINLLHELSQLGLDYPVSEVEILIKNKSDIYLESISNGCNLIEKIFRKLTKAGAFTKLSHSLINLREVCQALMTLLSF
jgi:hypothetical protein